MPTLVTAWLLSDIGNSFRCTGSDDDWYLDKTAGVFINAPGTGRIGVVGGNDIWAADRPSPGPRRSFTNPADLGARELSGHQEAQIGDGDDE